MKKIQSIICFLFFTAFACAQDSSLILKNYKEFKAPFIKLFKKPDYLNGNVTKNNLTFILPFYNNNTVIILPLDNMPCLIPDVSKVSKMPTRLSYGSAIKIPNKIIIP